MGLATGPDREPRCEMTASEVVAVVELLEEAGVPVWLDGGWAVDAAIGDQSRPHDDLDLVVELRHVDRLVRALGARRYALGRGQTPESIELVDSEGRQVDVHPVVFTPAGNGVYRMENGHDWIYPASGFAGEGRVSGGWVRCLTPEAQMLCHEGYEPHLSSYDDVWALSDAFGIPVPDAYRGPRESYPDRRA